MAEQTVPALAAPRRQRDNPLTRSKVGLAGLAFLICMTAACFGSLPFVTATVGDTATPRYNAGEPREGRLPPMWAPVDTEQALSLNRLVADKDAARIAAEFGVDVESARKTTSGEVASAMRRHWDRTFLGTDELGRSLWVRALLGGAISLGIGIAAAAISVGIGTIYGVIAGAAGGRVDAIMMRIVDVIYGLPYILLVVLLAVAVDGFVSNNAADWDLTQSQRLWIDLATLFIAIGGVSWLTMARVIRGQVLSLKNQPFMEAARAIGVPVHRQFLRHLLPNLLGPIIVYTTLTVPQAILQESFLSFLGIGVKPPLPSWGNLAADGLDQVNRHRSDWWLLLFPSVLLGSTLLALNFVGEGLREAFDPKRERQE
ncbi:MAG: ABC transporter permease [Planctomycetota bacterium]